MVTDCLLSGMAIISSVSSAPSAAATKGAKQKGRGGVMAAQALAKQKSLEKRAKKYKLPMGELAIFTQQLASLLDQARRDGEVQIRRQDGSTFVLRPVRAKRSPLDVPAVTTTLRKGELVEILRESRQGKPARMVKEPTPKPGKDRPPPSRKRPPRE